MTCSTTDRAVAGQHVNIGTVTASVLGDVIDVNRLATNAASARTSVTASDPTNYFGLIKPVSLAEPEPTVPPTPTAELPHTGTDTSGYLLWALGLLAAGVFATGIARRRRTSAPTAGS